MDKKYYSIGEVAKILDAKEHNLRSLDHLLGRKLAVIRGRRYYKNDDIDVLRNSMKVVAKNTKKLGGLVAEESGGGSDIGSLMNAMIALRAELLSVI